MWLVEAASGGGSEWDGSQAGSAVLGGVSGGGKSCVGVGGVGCFYFSVEMCWR